MEIKFRGQPDINMDKWVYGDLKRVSDNRRGGEFHYIYVSSDDVEIAGEEILVHASTVTQYTNLKDEQDGEIYVDDYLYYGTKLYIVMFYDGSFIIRPITLTTTEHDIILNSEITKNSLIAGSKHDEYQP